MFYLLSEYSYLYRPTAVSKHGVVGLLRGVCGGLGPNSLIRVNAVAPSWTETAIIPYAAFRSLQGMASSIACLNLLIALTLYRPGSPWSPLQRLVSVFSPQWPLHLEWVVWSRIQLATLKPYTALMAAIRNWKKRLWDPWLSPWASRA